MATPTVNTSSVTNSKIDVASIVSQLMEVERRPLTRLEGKISSADVKISTLGQFQAKLSALKSALTDLQTASSFTGVQPTFSKTGVLTATTSSKATTGSYTIEVARLAQPAVQQLEGFDSEANARAWFTGADTALREATSAAVIRLPDDTFAIRLTSKSGANFSVGATDLARAPSLTPPATQPAYQPLVTAEFTVNGSATYSRSSNSVSDVIEGVTLNLIDSSPDPVTMTLVTSAVTARPKIEALVTAYNELQALYKKETQPSAEAATRGILNSDSTLGTVMREILASFARPLAGPTGAALSGQRDLTVLGLKLNDTGQLVLDDSLLSKSTDLQSHLANGLRIGFDGNSSKDLLQKVTDMLATGGLLFERVKRERESQTELSKQKTVLESKLVTVQSRLTAQFAALDALLFKLSNTSDALKSSLDALANSQKND